MKMKENQVYLVSDLAQELNVPRTTVNDWLKRFDRYIVYVMSGRRKAYGTPALEVLKEISKLRNEGVSNSGIEEVLSRKYPIRPEIAADDEPLKEKEPENLPARNELASLLPAYLEQGEKLFAQQQKQVNKTIFSFMLLVVVLVIFSVVVSTVVAMISFGRSNRMMAQERAALEQKLSVMEKFDQEKTLLYQQQLEEMENKLLQNKIQAEEFAAEQASVISELRKELNTSLVRVMEQLENNQDNISAQLNDRNILDDRKNLADQEKFEEQKSRQEQHALELKAMQENLKLQQKQLEAALAKLNEVSGKITDLSFKAAVPEKPQTAETVESQVK